MAFTEGAGGAVPGLSFGSPWHLDVATVDTRSWGEQGGSYSPDRRYQWRYERTIGSGPPICWIGLNPGTGDREGRYLGRAQTMFGADRWARLQAVKRSYDPTNVLRYNANIAP